MNNKRINGWLAVLAVLVLTGAGVWTADAAGSRAPEYVVSTDSDSWEGNRAYLGVEIEEEIDHPEGGARLTEVVDDSPADRAGLKRDDIVVGIDGHTIRGPAGLSHRLHDMEPGDTVTIEFIRDGRSQKIDAELGQRSDAWRSVLAPGVAPFAAAARAYALACGDDDDCRPLRFYGAGRPRLGVQLTETTAELRRFLGGTDESGVLVSKVLSGTAAEDAGILVGDLIVAVDGEEVANHWTLQQALAQQEGTFEIEIVRGGVSVTLQVRFPESEDKPTGPTA